MIEVVSRGRSTFRDNYRSTLTALVIAFTHGGVFWRSKARLIDAFLAIGLVEDMQFGVHILRLRAVWHPCYGWWPIAYCQRLSTWSITIRANVAGIRRRSLP